MAEWSVTGTERDVLLATKLYLPGPRPGQVSRPRLLARLRRALDTGPSAPDPGLSGLIDPLTGREHEVLTMLAAGRSNQPSPASPSSRWTRSRSTSATSRASSARPTAPRPWPGRAS